MATDQGRDRPTRDLDPFMGRVVPAIMQIGAADRAGDGWIPDRDIGVRARGSSWPRTVGEVSETIR